MNVVRFSDQNVDALAQEVDSLKRAMEEREHQLPRSRETGKDILLQ